MYTAAVTSSTQVIEVNAEALSIDTTTPNIQNTFDNRQLQDLPTATVGLGVLNLSLLDAGVATTGGSEPGTGPSVSGQRPRNNNSTSQSLHHNRTPATITHTTIH